VEDRQPDRREDDDQQCGVAVLVDRDAAAVDGVEGGALGFTTRA
jgi:hypothetical protein